MSREYSLAHLSMIAVPPARLADVAAGAGFDWFSLRLTPSPSTGVDHGHLGDERALESLRRHIDDSGSRLLDLEVVRMKGPESVAQAQPLLEAAQALGARYVIATVEDSDPVRRVETLTALAESAARHDTAVALEFMMFTASPTLADAVDVVRASGALNVVVLPDVLHVVRSGGTLDEVAGTDPALLPYAQICGASGAGPAPDPDAARAEGVRARLLPDEGDLPVREFVAALPASTILAVESPLAGQADPADPAALAARMMLAGRRVAGEVE
jgi:sugar phosphate isomerase/epimerase